MKFKNNISDNTNLDLFSNLEFIDYFYTHISFVPCNSPGI